LSFEIKGLELNFLRVFITTNDGPMLLTIEGKWLKTILQMPEFQLLNLPCSK
jgi:hypothetical protein